MKFLGLTCWWICGAATLLAQPSTPEEIQAAYQVRRNLADHSLLKEYPARNIGPTVQGGRIIDIDVNLHDTKNFYVAYASGGLFKTVNNGITFEPIFDNLDALGIGDFALSPSDPNVLYVGTGEKNSSRSSYAGSGVYKTTDGGRHWSHIGLTATQHISRVIIHPEDNNTVWVAAMGNLYTHNADRGVFKTTDGGHTWKKTLYINDSTGVIDLLINPRNPQQLWAAAWERTRKASHFKGQGVGSAIYRSDDGGDTWVKSVAGLPQGSTTGRIGLDLCATQPNIVYAILDNQREVEDKPAKKSTTPSLTLDDLRKMSQEEFLKLEDKKLNDLLRDQGFPARYTTESVKRDVREGLYTVQAIADYFGADANQNLFKTKVIGAEVYRSDDGGTQWKKVNRYDLDGVFFTYGYYFAEMKVAPDDPSLIYIYGVPMLKSRDGGATWHRLDTLRGVRDIHVDHHALWINPRDHQHMLLGNDGGLYQTYDEGANWLHINNMSVGQFYTVNVDMETPYNVYGGLQDNGVLKGSSRSIPNETKQWKPLFGGDGMYVAADPRKIYTVYTGYQFGNYFRLEMDKGKTTRITPQHNIGEAPLRWNWRSPLLLSRHNADIIYMAANRVFRSLDKGEHWEAISPDLTRNLKQGNVPISTLSALAESPRKFGLLYAGSDDGLVHISRDGGGHWEPIHQGLPAGRWVSAIFPSPHHDGHVFITLNGYREDEFKSYLYVSTDYGQHWTSVKGNLPESVANVLIQDPVNPDLLYCGLDNGTYVSLDKGKTWQLFNALLNVPGYDMLVHPRDNELVVGTHGRSVYIADAKPLQAIAGRAQQPIMVFSPESIRHSDNWGVKTYPWSKASEPRLEVLYYVGQETKTVVVEVLNSKQEVVRRIETQGAAGFHRWTWDVRVQTPVASKSRSKAPASPELSYATAGKYTVRMTNGKAQHEVAVEIK